MLNPAQCGFLRKCNTFKALNVFYNDVFSAFHKKTALPVFIDFAKAFDIVNHNIFINEIHPYGTRGPILSWFKDYSADRHQYTEFKGGKKSQNWCSAKEA